MNKVVNTSGLKPLGRALLLLPYEPELKKSVIAMPETVSKRLTMVETRAIVIEIGPVAWDDEPAPRAKVGDKVFITKFAGIEAVGPKDGKTYRICNDRDCFCRLED